MLQYPIAMNMPERDMSARSMSASLLSEAHKRWRHLPFYQDARRWIRDNMPEFTTRVSEYNQVLEKINNLFGTPQLNQESLRDVLALRQAMGFLHATQYDTLPSLSETILYYKNDLESGDQEEIERTEGAIDSITQKMDPIQGEWKFPFQVTGGQLISGLLIEGYAQMMAHYYELPIARTHVLAVEEVLMTFYPGSRLFQDVKVWMKEEKDDFPPLIAQQLEKL